ncbi:hypothetical protein FBUS_00642 [Fasciolopsis buskii]|uniref:Uncharacterized protein n=1 Tax=Fasciolopsis buskii TaxID=27845 RepID=A0A8E0VHZ0_9TREM|nr:hypothetical protein FBUS_00642 [Fasciolopsis buski]
MKPSTQSGLETPATDAMSAEHMHLSSGVVNIGPSPSTRRSKDHTDTGHRGTLKSINNRTEPTGKSCGSHPTAVDQLGFVSRVRSTYSSRSRSRSGRTTDPVTKHPNAQATTDYSPCSKMHGTLSGHQQQSIPSQTVTSGLKPYGPSPTESVSTTSDSRDQERRQVTNEDYIGECYSIF